MAERDRRPDVTPFGWAIDAFWELSTARQFGFGVGPIPVPILWQYSDRYDCPAWFVDVMQAADLQWLKLANAPAKASMDAKRSAAHG